MSRPGFTLIETLVMLVIAGLVAAVTLEAIRAATSNGIRIEQAARGAAGEFLDKTILRATIEGTRTDYRDSPNAFAGEETEFSGLTASPIGANSDEFRPYTIRFEEDGDQLILIYEDDQNTLELARWYDVSGRFEYFGRPASEALPIGLPDAEKAEWFRSWPPVSAIRSSSSYFVALPLAIAIRIGEDREDQSALIVHLPANAPPPARVEDIFGVAG